METVSSTWFPVLSTIPILNPYVANHTPFFCLFCFCNRPSSLLRFGRLQLYCFRSFANHWLLGYDSFCASRRYIFHKGETTREFDHKPNYGLLLHSSMSTGHSLYNRLCNWGSLWHLHKFIEYYRIVALLPVIPLGIRNNW